MLKQKFELARSQRQRRRQIFAIGKFPNCFKKVTLKLQEEGFFFNRKHLTRLIDYVILGDNPGGIALAQANALERAGNLKILKFPKNKNVKEFVEEFHQASGVRIDVKNIVDDDDAAAATDGHGGPDDDDNVWEEIKRGKIMIKEITENVQNFDLHGVRVMFGGELNIFKSNAFASAVVTSLGAAVETKNITKSLTIFVIGKNPPPIRTATAKRYGVKIMREPQFIKYIIDKCRSANMPTIPAPKKRKRRIIRRSSSTSSDDEERDGSPGNTLQDTLQDEGEENDEDRAALLEKGGEDFRRILLKYATEKKARERADLSSKLFVAQCIANWRALQKSLTPKDVATGGPSYSASSSSSSSSSSPPLPPESPPPPESVRVTPAPANDDDAEYDVDNLASLASSL